jgi:hypothetical protein
MSYCTRKSCEDDTVAYRSSTRYEIYVNASEAQTQLGKKRCEEDEQIWRDIQQSINAILGWQARHNPPAPASRWLNRHRSDHVSQWTDFTEPDFWWTNFDEPDSQWTDFAEPDFWWTRIIEPIFWNTVQCMKWNFNEQVFQKVATVVMHPHFQRNHVPIWPKYSSAPSFPQIPCTYLTKIF